MSQATKKFESTKLIVPEHAVAPPGVGIEAITVEGATVKPIKEGEVMGEEGEAINSNNDDKMDE